MDTGTASHQQQQQQQQHIRSLEEEEDRGEGAETETETETCGGRGMNVVGDAGGALTIDRTKEDSEVPEDIRAFYGHPLTAASHSADGDGLALLHEYQSLPFIDRSAAAAAAAMNDAVFATGNDISQRYPELHANALEYEESLELDHHHHHHHHHHHQLPPISVQSSSTSSAAEFVSSGELIRQNALFTEETDELSERPQDADLIRRYDEAFLQPRKNSMHDLNSSPATNLTQSQFGSRPESESPSEFPEAAGDMIAEEKALFSSFEDEDAALTYYGQEVDDDDDFPVTTTTMVAYDLVMPPHHHHHQASKRLDIIPIDGGGDLAASAGMFCGTSSCSSSEENLVGDKQSSMMLAAINGGLEPSDARFYGGLFPRGRMKSGGGKFAVSVNNDGAVIGGTKQTRRRPAAGTGTTRKRKALNALLPGNSLPRPELEFYHSGIVDDRTFSLSSKYDLNPILNSSLHLAQNFACPPPVSENALRSAAYATSHDGYQSAFTYLDSEYQTLLASSDDQRMAGLNGQKEHHLSSVNSSANLEYQRRDISSEVWQTTFLSDDEFHLNPSSGGRGGGYAQEPNSHDEIQWGTISTPDFQTISCSAHPPVGATRAASTCMTSSSSSTAQEFRIPWQVTSSDDVASSSSSSSSLSNAPLDMSASIGDPHGNALRTSRPEVPPPLLPPPPPPSSSSEFATLPDQPPTVGVADHRRLYAPPPKSAATARRPRRRQIRTLSAGGPAGAESIVPSGNLGMDAVRFIPSPLGGAGNRRSSNSYGTPPDFGAAKQQQQQQQQQQRQMPGLIPSNLLNFADLDDVFLQQTEASNPKQTIAKFYNHHLGAESVGLASSNLVHQIRPSYTQEQTNNVDPTRFVLNPPNNNNNNNNNSLAETVNRQQQQLPVERHLSNPTENAASLTSLPFPIPAVPPGYRLVITHHPIPTENDKEPQHITQLIIDNPRTVYHQTNPPQPQPQPQRLVASQPPPPPPSCPAANLPGRAEAGGGNELAMDLARAVRPNTLEFLPEAATARRSLPGQLLTGGSSSASSGGGGIGDVSSQFLSLKHEPESPLDGVSDPTTDASGRFRPVNSSIILSPSAATASTHPPGLPIDLLEMSMREAKVMPSTAAAAGFRQSVDRPSLFPVPVRHDVVAGGGRIGESSSADNTPVAPPSAPLTDGIGGPPSSLYPPGVGEGPLPLNLSEMKPVLVGPGTVQSYPYEVNNNHVQFGAAAARDSTAVVDGSSGPATPTGIHPWCRVVHHDHDSSRPHQSDGSAAVHESFAVTPEAVPGSIVQRRLSSSSSRKGVRSRTPSVRRTKTSTVEKIDPDLSGYEFYLDAPISTKARFDEDRVTYLNKGQYYSLVLKFDPTQESDFVYRNVPVKSVVMVMFRERQSSEEELKAWEFWHSRQHSLKQRVLDVDGKNFGGENVPLSVDEIAYNAVKVIWTRQDKPVKVNIALNCLSTDFSHQKGVKGNPLHIQIDTFADDSDTSTLVHRAYCQIKVFCDKGADRKSREEERKRTKSIESDISEDRHHDPCDRSFFYRMADNTTPPMLFTPTNSLASKSCIKDSSYHLDTLCVEKRLGIMDDDGSTCVPAKRPRSCSYDQHRMPQRILLYAREEADEVFTALMLESPTVSSLLNAIQEKFNVPVNAIRNVYNRSRKGVTVKLDDNVVRHFSNESTFIISIEPLQQKPVANDYGDDQTEMTTCYDVTLAEIQP